MKLNDKEYKIVKKLASNFKKKFGAEEVLLYGSLARGDGDKYSDIDLFLVLPDLDLKKENAIREFCYIGEEKCNRLISAICFTTHELNNSPLRFSPMVLNARREGMPI